MTNQEKIEEIKSQVRKNRIQTLDELEIVCGETIDPFDDILGPMGWNCCDRCGALGDSELDFIWLDYFEWDENNPEDKKLLAGLEKEGSEYCAICDKCIKELKDVASIV